MNRTGMNPPARSGLAGPGFTLVETAAASACTGILVAGLASCLLIAGHAFDEDRTVLTAQTRAAEPLDRVLSDLRYATAVTEQTATAVTFQVPDRNGDAIQETIRYSWSGIAGDPLLMTYNGSSPAALVPHIQAFNLAYPLRTVTGTGFAQGALTCEEVVLGSHDDATGGTFGTLGITAAQWHALYLVPTLQSGTVSWDLTQVRLCLGKSGGATGSFAVQVRLPAEGADLKPSDTVLEEVVMPESALGSSAGWKDFSFSAVAGLDPGQAVFVVVKHAGLGGTTVAVLEYETGIPDEPGHALYQTTDTGATWSLLTGELRFSVSGVAHY
ncbi:MAG: hypothetical protein KBE04_12075 [Phycisphaerae bacterium]|nr:hypothetical protein [Phycisphaerae bacterium]